LSVFGERKNRYIFATLFSKALNSTFKPEITAVSTRLQLMLKMASKRSE
jgi:hypothetical protein